MAIDTPEKRRAAFNCLLTPWIVLPLSSGTIADEDRAMAKGVYLVGSFPPPQAVIGSGQWFRKFSARIGA